MAELKVVFEALDPTGKGYITGDEFKKSFQAFEGASLLEESSDEKILKSAVEREKKIDAIIKEISTDVDGHIYFENFVYGIGQIMNSHKPQLPLTSNSQDLILFDKVTSPSGKPHFALDDVDSMLSLASTSDQLSPPADVDTGLDMDETEFSYRSETQRSAASRLLVRNRSPQQPQAVSARPPSHPGAAMRRDGVRATWPKRRQRDDEEMEDGMGEARGGVQLEGLQPGDLESYSSYASSLGGSRSDLMLGEWDQHVSTLQEHMRRLEHKLEELHANRATNEARNARLRDENRSLLERMHNLEDAIREADANANSFVEAEKEKLRQQLVVAEREHHTELDKLRHNVYSLEKEVSELRVQAASLKGEVEKYAWSQNMLQEKLSESESKLASVQKEYERQKEFTKAEIETLKKERSECEKNLDRMSQEVLLLRERCGSSLSPSGSATSPLSPGVTDLHQRYREVQELVRSLSVENKSLRQQLTDAQEDLLYRAVEDGQALLRRNEMSLAAELENYTKDELLDMLVREKDANCKLRDYVGNILVKVMERDPSLLEINAK